MDKSILSLVDILPVMMERVHNAQCHAERSWAIFYKNLVDNVAKAHIVCRFKANMSGTVLYINTFVLI